jgi:hypothetical protein
MGSSQYHQVKPRLSPKSRRNFGLAERGYLPIELLDALRSGAIPQDTGSGA